MRHIRSLLIVVFLLIAGCYFILQFNDYLSTGDKSLTLKEIADLPKLKSNQDSKDIGQLLTGDLFDLMNQSSSDVITTYGVPIRKDLSAYGYEWWIYESDYDEYVQIGIENDTVHTIFGTGDTLPSAPFEIGMSYDELNNKFKFKNKVTYQKGLSFYSFILNDDDLMLNPLVKLSDNLFIQCNFDTITERLSSIRMLTGDVLLDQRFYEMEYRGSLPDEYEFSDDEWEQIEKGMEQQILKITNMYRVRHNIPSIILDDAVSIVAYNHSKDMAERDYFAHDDPDGKGLGDRLHERNVYYLSAGENIAAQHSDAVAATEGWLNSESHRQALLSADYSHIGIGVYRFYYTQNFIAK